MVLRKHFPGSPKTMRMLGMLYEAQYDLQRARDIYNELLAANPSDAQTLKRIVALERDSNKTGEAITLLNKYLEVNQQDVDAWLELTDIYLSKLNYSKAQFCYEEILTLQPNNPIVNINFAEMLYS